MPCYHPIPARSSSGGGPWAINPPRGEADRSIPCGKCLGCRTATQNAWTHRCTHEAQLWDHNRFITLTYDDEHLPHELVPYHLTTFLKRLRYIAQTHSQILTHPEGGIRYLACGEYGDRTLRPHYHLNLFNCSFKDERPYSKELTTSHTLDNIWGYGATKLAPFTPATAGYVAGYITKHGHRDYYNAEGELLQPPFKRQSTKPAIGHDWLLQYHSDLQHGYLVTNDGKQSPLPQYYKKLLAQLSFRKDLTPLTRELCAIHRTNQTLGDNLATEYTPTDAHTPPRLQDAERIHQQHHARRQRDL